MDDLFKKFQAEGAKTIHALVEMEQQETLKLDFKANAIKDGRTLFEKEGRNLSKDGKRAIAKELSAFANSAGGLLILGVDCSKKHAGDIDCADKATPLTNLAACHATMNNEISQLVQPVIDDIDIITVLEEGMEDEGYIILKIPRSPRRPHRGEAASQKQYYKRMGSSSLPMEHYDIEDAFKRSNSPDLELRHEVTMLADSSAERIVACKLIAKNIGEATAKNIHIEIKNGFPFHVDRGFRYRDTVSQVETISGNTIIICSDNRIVFPRTERVIDDFGVLYSTENRKRIWKLAGTTSGINVFKIECVIVCDGMRPKNILLEIPELDFRAAARL